MSVKGKFQYRIQLTSRSGISVFHGHLCNTRIYLVNMSVLSIYLDDVSLFSDPFSYNIFVMYIMTISITCMTGSYIRSHI
jgi:hypothetical protein